jgi:predicted Zn-dependent peptidase
VGRLEQAKLFGYYGDRFRGGNVVFTAAGNLDHQRFVDEVRRRFETMPAGVPEDANLPPSTSAKIVLRNKKALEQVQLCMGVPSLPISSDRRYCALVLNTVLGGGMSSRLFQTVREERGLAYSIYSDLNPYKDTGMLCVYAGTSSDRALQVIQLVTDEFRRLKQELMPEDELRRAKDQLLGNIILSMESTGARMSNLARQEMYFNHFFGIEEVMQQVEQVTAEQTMELARELFDPEKIAVTMLGRLDGIKVGRGDLVC